MISTIEASKKPDYTTFLKNFGKFVVANLEEKPLNKDEFIIESLQDMRRELAKLSHEQREVMMIARSGRRFPLPPDAPSVKDFLIRFLNSRPCSPEDIEALKDPTSKIFRELHGEYIERVLSRIVNPKSRHELMAKEELLEAIKRYLS